MNLPNKITISRILLIPVFVAVYYLEVIPFNFVISAVIFAIASLTDFLDGAIARKRNLVTSFGKFLDPIADKVLVSTALILLLLPISADPFALAEYGIPAFLPAIFVAVILARELIISGFRLVAAEKGMVISADKWGKVKTFFTDVMIVWVLVFMNFDLSILKLVGFILFGIAVILTVYSGIECLVKNKEIIKEK
ncbi:MAG: CDP-diacylglycerol--glycerol-3-phosphate 3-phosphatidyltransferase [Clostridia bacterium]|nr:CDP-diacylglycerol--glycerol-3-phosphate 3-phosphatidyltransferase [Clostridia bacterium]